jgi:predicted lipoprotein with Yx(FWY)xxD motif
MAAMMTRSKMVYVVIALAGLASVTACAGQAVTPGTIFVPAAAPASSPAPSGSAPGLSGRAAAPQEVPTAVAPIPEPTVAKVQKWVKIFSGQSKKNVTPPKSIRVGSHTVELNATPQAQIGTYVADGAGRTLYRFDKDSARPSKSNCNGDCATAWPPLLIKSPGKIYPKGVNPKILGYVERADHTCQVTIDGHPVYYFAGDAKPGDIDGQGVNGTWFAVSPTGGKTKPFPDALPGTVPGTGTPGN